MSFFSISERKHQRCRCTAETSVGNLKTIGAVTDETERNAVQIRC